VISAAGIEEARAVPLTDVIAARGLRLRRSGAELVGPCVLCGGHDRFAINPRRGLWLCRHCGQGGNDAISLVRFLDGCTFAVAVATLAGTTTITTTNPNHRLLAPSPPHHDVERENIRRVARARAVWDGATPGVGSPVERYLAGRGITAAAAALPALGVALLARRGTPMVPGDGSAC
jgi:phage/plasmid primase-like uncharacterized protein